jgi:hypothetical protein
MLTGVALECDPSGCGEVGSVEGTNSAPDHADVGNWYTGWYLFALDALLGSPISGLVGYSSPAAIQPWTTSGIIVRSRPYGPVTGPASPTITFLSRTHAHGAHVAVAIIHCATSCPTNLSVSLTHAVVDTQDTWTAHDVITGTRTIGVSATLPSGQASGTLPSGRVIVSVQIGNGPYVKGHSLVR